MSEGRNVRSYLSVRDAMRDGEEIRQNATMAVQAKQAELRALCEGGSLYVQGECGECDKAATNVRGAPMDAYPPEDQAFYRFWYSHMKDDIMQPPLAGVRHATARYIWDAARGVSASDGPIVSAVPAAAPAAPPAKPTMICPRCKADRFKEPCPNRIDCPMVATALSVAAPDALSRSPQAVQEPASTQAARDVLAERQRQRDKWGDHHDDQHTNDALAYGAVSYLLPGQKPMPADWAYKSKVLDRDSRREQLVKGAACAIAAVEQFDRASALTVKD